MYAGSKSLGFLQATIDVEGLYRVLDGPLQADQEVSRSGWVASREYEAAKQAAILRQLSKLLVKLTLELKQAVVQSD